MPARRKCRLAVTDYKDIDLRKFEDIIVRTVNETVKGKNPKVFKDYFSTDLLTQSEAVAIGRALAKLTELKHLGKTVTTFRLFDGKLLPAGRPFAPDSCHGIFAVFGRSVPDHRVPCL